MCNVFSKKETHMCLSGGRFAIRHLITLFLLVVTTLIVAKPEEENAFNLAGRQNCPFENHQGLI